MVYENGFFFTDSHLMRYTGKDKVVVVPEGTEHIEELAFSSKNILVPNDSIEEIVLPEGLKSIGKNAFFNCRRLRKITFPESLVKIYESAFQGCEKLESVQLHGEIRIIEESAFHNCKSLKSVEIKGKNVSIMDWAFFGCKNLSEVTLHHGVNFLGRSSFGFCGSLRSISLPDSVKFIGKRAFTCCENLEQIRLPAKLKLLTAETFYRCESLGEIEIPDTVGEIGDACFKYCDALKSIRAMGVKDIKGSPFPEDMKLILPNAKLATDLNKETKYQLLESFIDNRSLYDDEAAKDYTRYACARRNFILEYAFKSDKAKFVEFYKEIGKITKDNVDSEYIEPALRHEAQQCFAAASAWKSENLSFSDFDDEFDLDSKKYTGVTYMKKIWSYETYSDGSAKINGYKGSDTEVYVPAVIGKKQVKVIGEYVFSPARNRYIEQIRENRRRITGVTIPEGVRIIGRYAFLDCKKLTYVKLPEGLRRICACAFAGCESLTELELPESLTELDTFSLACMPALKKIRIPSGIRVVESGVFNMCEALEEVIISEGVRTIADTFFCCDKLRYIEIPASVTAIDDDLALSVGSRMTIGGKKGSYAESYARKHQIIFKEI